MENYIAGNIKFLREANGLSQAQLAERVNLSRDKIASYERGTEPRIAALVSIVEYFHISIEHFIHKDISEVSVTPDGNVLWDETKSAKNVLKIKDAIKTKGAENVTFSNGNKKGNIFTENEKRNKRYPLPGAEQVDIIDDIEVQKFNLKTDSNHEQQSIPLYDLEAFAGLVPLFKDTDTQTPVDYINIPNLPKCDGAVHVTGDSMYPLLKSGDMVLYKQINDVANNIFWGEMYLVSIDVEGEEYVSVKYIQKSELKDHIKLVSHNQHHSDKNVRIDRVKALAFVKASIRINSMK